MQGKVRYTLHLGQKQQPPQMPLLCTESHQHHHQHYQSLVILIGEVETDLRMFRRVDQHWSGIEKNWGEYFEKDWEHFPLHASHQISFVAIFSGCDQSVGWRCSQWQPPKLTRGIVLNNLRIMQWHKSVASVGGKLVSGNCTICTLCSGTSQWHQSVALVSGNCTIIVQSAH